MKEDAFEYFYQKVIIKLVEHPDVPQAKALLAELTENKKELLEYFPGKYKTQLQNLVNKHLIYGWLDKVETKNTVNSLKEFFNRDIVEAIPSDDYIAGEDAFKKIRNLLEEFVEKDPTWHAEVNNFLASINEMQEEGKDPVYIKMELRALAKEDFDGFWWKASISLALSQLIESIPSTEYVTYMSMEPEGASIASSDENISFQDCLKASKLGSSGLSTESEKSQDMNQSNESNESNESNVSMSDSSGADAELPTPVDLDEQLDPSPPQASELPDIEDLLKTDRVAKVYSIRHQRPDLTHAKWREVEQQGEASSRKRKFGQ